MNDISNMTLARGGSRRGRERGGTRRALVAAVCAGALLVIALTLIAACSLGSGPSEAEASGPVDTSIPATADEPAVTSTPREEWRKGEMPYLYQIDPQWADAEYCGGTFAEQGCGPTALTMVYVYLTGDTSYDPVQMAAFSTENGYATNGNGSAWTLMSEGAATLGLNSQTLPAVESQLKAELEAGHPLICAMEPGTFTRVGHYIVVEGMASDGTHVLVHDSNSVGRSMRVWDLETICAEAQNIWSFSVA